MQIHGAYTRGIQGHLFTVSAAPNRAGRLHIAGVRDTVAQQTATTVTHALKRLGIGDIGTDVRLEPAGAADPPLATGRYSGTLDLPIALAVLAIAGKLPVDRIADVVAVGGLDPYAANESAGVRCISAGGTTAIAHAAGARGLRLIVAEDQAAAACAECRETTGAMTLEELVAVLAGHQDGEPLPHRTAAVKRRDPAAWRISEGDLRALEIACAGWHNIHVIGPDSRSLPRYGRIAQALLPDLAGEAARETTTIHGAAGLMAPWIARITEPPLRVPHCTVWAAPSRAAGAGPAKSTSRTTASSSSTSRPSSPGPSRRPRRRRRGRPDRHLSLFPRRAHDPDAGPLPAHGDDPARRARRPAAPRRGPAQALRHRDHRRHADRRRNVPRTPACRPGARRPGGGDPRGCAPAPHRRTGGVRHAEPPHPGRGPDRRSARRTPAARERGPRRSRTPPPPRRPRMTARQEPPPPIRQDLRHRHPSQGRLTCERDAAERRAWDALARYKFVMFGY